MSIRRVGKSGLPATPTGKTSRTQAAGGATFAQHLESMAGIQARQPVLGVDAVDAVSRDDTPPHQAREQLDQAEALLDSLEALEKELAAGQGKINRERLRQTRDEALRTLSNSPGSGRERDLLHRTTVLATVELAKSDRGDYQ